jgi:3-hydroxyacyl-CoA dehydrogenase
MYICGNKFSPMKLGDISNAIKEKHPEEVIEAHSINLINYMTGIELLKKKKKVKVTLELPLDFLKDPNDVREINGFPVITLIDLKK